MFSRSKRPPKNPARQDPQTTEWSNWDWSEEYSCYVRSRDNADGKVEWQYGQKPPLSGAVDSTSREEQTTGESQAYGGSDYILSGQLGEGQGLQVPPRGPRRSGLSNYVANTSSSIPLEARNFGQNILDSGFRDGDNSEYAEGSFRRSIATPRTTSTSNFRVNTGSNDYGADAFSTLSLQTQDSRSNAGTDRVSYFRGNERYDEAGLRYGGLPDAPSQPQTSSENDRNDLAYRDSIDPERAEILGEEESDEGESAPKKPKPKPSPVTCNQNCRPNRRPPGGGPGGANPRNPPPSGSMGDSDKSTSKKSGGSRQNSYGNEKSRNSTTSKNGTGGKQRPQNGPNTKAETSMDDEPLIDYNLLKDITCPCGFGYYTTGGQWVSGAEVRAGNAPRKPVEV